MTKYIRTYLNSKKSILKITGCETCPLMNLNILTFSCQCRYYKSYLSNDNMIKDFVSVYYYLNDRVIECIDIPHWCKLPNNIKEIEESNNTFSLKEFGINVDTEDTEKNVTIIESFKLSDVNGYNTLPNVYKSAIPLPSSFPSMGEHGYNGNGFNTTSTPKYEYCSLCGEEDESVNRNENFGMCESCIELSENDEMKLNQAYINNFRLKRKIKIETNTQFKRLKII